MTLYAELTVTAGFPAAAVSPDLFRPSRCTVEVVERHNLQLVAIVRTDDIAPSRPDQTILVYEREGSYYTTVYGWRHQTLPWELELNSPAPAVQVDVQRTYDQGLFEDYPPIHLAEIASHYLGRCLLLDGQLLYPSQHAPYLLISRVEHPKQRTKTFQMTLAIEYPHSRTVTPVAGYGLHQFAGAEHFLEELIGKEVQAPNDSAHIGAVPKLGIEGVEVLASNSVILSEFAEAYRLAAQEAFIFIED